jgi:hypothetical protein
MVIGILHPVKRQMFGNKKSTCEYFASALFLAPRDRIELPTRGFSDQIVENSKMV